MLPKSLSMLIDRKRNNLLTKDQVVKDLIAGIIVGIIALPLSVALGISSGVTPEVGLITAIIAGLCIALFGGSNVQIGGPTGAFVVIVYGIIQKHGLSGLIIATMLAGIMLILMGLFKLGNLIKYVPKPIVIGFTSGIGVTLLATQIKELLGLNINKGPSEFIHKIASYIENIGTLSLMAIVISIISIIIIKIVPKYSKLIPGSLVAIVVTTLLVQLLHINIATIGSTFGEISSTIPMPSIPQINMQTIIALIGPALTIAFLAGVESLLSAVVADDMIGSGEKHDSNMELVGQGIANIASALFGGIPATGAIARTAANIKNGGRTPIAGVVHAMTLFIIMKVLMPYIQYVPLATLAAILVTVSMNMIEFDKMKEMITESKTSMIVVLITFIFTVVFDLVFAIVVAMILYYALLFFNKNTVEEAVD